MVAKNDTREFEQLLETHRGIAFKVAFTYSRTKEERDDLVQEIYLQLWRSFPTYERTRRFSTWMYRVALNAAISHARRLSRDGRQQSEPLTDVHLETIGAAENDPEDERLDTLRLTLNQLEPLNRTLMMLYLDECSYAEIAEIVGLRETNVATKINRIKKRLRSWMADSMTGV